MSQVAHPHFHLPHPEHARRAAWLAAGLTLAAVVAIVLILAIDNGDDATVPATATATPAQSTSGPNEAATAAAVGTLVSSGSSESNVAAAVGGGEAPSQVGSSESNVAAAVGGGGSTSSTSSGPDESQTGAAISGLRP
jgi:hypothetical protein